MFYHNFHSLKHQKKSILSISLHFYDLLVFSLMKNHSFSIIWYCYQSFHLQAIRFKDWWMKHRTELVCPLNCWTIEFLSRSKMSILPSSSFPEVSKEEEIHWTAKTLFVSPFKDFMHLKSMASRIRIDLSSLPLAIKILSKIKYSQL